ncbi:MAG: hypothetical protein BWY95_00212 [Bacteroidetes bacterium ADurb.BinA104]|nr:MAG: hypothetical protein BWY95_00212 [Bacteroidetes bacterium ADurb.BinA104]
MKAKVVFGMILCAVIIGCVNSATRFTLDPNEGIYIFQHDTSKDQRTAYYLAEEWLSSNIRNANDAITMRQIETGTLVANPTMQIPVGIVQFWCGYTVIIVCQDNKLATKFTVGKLDNGTYPSKNAMADIESKFHALSISLRDYINNN